MSKTQRMYLVSTMTLTDKATDISDTTVLQMHREGLSPAAIGLFAVTLASEDRSWKSTSLEGATAQSIYEHTWAVEELVERGYATVREEPYAYEN